MFAGTGPGTSVVVESYDCTNWTTVNSLINTRTNTAGAGTQTAGLAISGGPSPLTVVEAYDGTNWSTMPSVATARVNHQAAGTQPAAIISGGDPTRKAPGEFTGETTTETASSVDFD